jgi:hypothetical protein
MGANAFTRTDAVFPGVPARKGMYESFYIRAVAPDEPVGIWIRHTVQKPPGRKAYGSLWCTVFDAARGRPFMHKLSSEELTAPPAGWIAVGRTDEGEQGGRMGASTSDGACGAASWSLRFDTSEPELRHLPREWLYRAPMPRTKLTSPAPAARFDGRLELAGGRALELAGWRGMVGHNWGAEHAERWIWLHGVGFEQEPDAWLDVALGRVRIAGRLTPWIANGALSLGGRRLRVGGLAARGLRVAEGVEGCSLSLPGEHGLAIEARAEIPAGSAAGWRYADPDGSDAHDVVNCSIAALTLSVRLPGEAAARTLTSAHGGVYELGMRERDHGVPIAPFAETMPQEPVAGGAMPR